MAPTSRASWGHRIRAATADERAGVFLLGRWIERPCGHRCGEPIRYQVSYFLTVEGPAGEHPRSFRRFVCMGHARRWARRYALTLPYADPPVDQTLLPFGGA